MQTYAAAPPQIERKISYRPDIDGLRAIAVLAVIGYHYFPSHFPGGFVGVDVFFVISGFLISSIIYEEIETKSFSIPQFYIRRIRRIYPALFLVLAAVSVAGWFILLPHQFLHLGQQILGGATFSANFVLWMQSGYFSQDSTLKPLLHLWSLGVEEQYYLCFPLICLLFYSKKQRWTLPAVFLAIAALSMIVNVSLVTRYRDAMFFLPFSRFWELFLGATLALVERRVPPGWGEPVLSSLRSPAGFLGLGLLFLSLVRINQDDSFPGWWALLPTLGTALLIAAGPRSWVNRCLLSLRPAVFIGLISYPLYLWHWPILSFDRIVTTDVLPVRSVRIAMLGAAFLLAYLTYRFVETPIRRVRQKRRRQRGALWLLGSVSLVGAFGLLAILTTGFPVRFPKPVAALDHDYEADAASAYREGTCFLRPDQSADSFSDACVDPARQRPAPLVLVWGDSHAADLIPGLRAAQANNDFRLAQFTSSGCAPILGLTVRPRPFCRLINDAVMNRIRNLKPDIVVLSGFWGFGSLDQNRAAMLRMTIDQIRSAGVRRVVVIGSAPFWKTAVPTLLMHEAQLHPSIPVGNTLPRTLLRTQDTTLPRVVAGQAGATFISLFDDLCGPVDCLVATSPNWQGVMTYDDAHFTPKGSVLVVQKLLAKILQG